MEEKEKIGAAVAAEKSDDGVQKEQTVLSVEKTEIPVADSKNQKDANDESGKSKSAEEKNVKASGADGVNTENKTSDVPEKSEFLDKLMNEARSTYKETVQPVSDGGNEDTDNEDEMVDISDLSALNSADISSNSENKTANISDDKAKKIKSNELSNTVRISLADMTEAMEKSADEKQKRKDERNKKQESKNGSVFLKIVGGLVASVVIIGGAFVCMYKFNPDVIPVAASANVPGGIVRASDEEPVFLKGIKVQGQELEGKTLDEAKSLLAVRGTTIFPQVNMTVNYEGVDYVYDREDFDFLYDINAVIEKAYEYNQKVLDSGSNDILTYAPGDGTAEVDTENNTVNFLVEHKITQASVQKVIRRVAKKVDVPCVEPHVSKYDTSQSKNSKRYTFEEGSQGKSIDQDALIKAAMDAFNGGQTSVSLTAQSHETKPTLQMSDVKQATKLIGKFSTITTNSYNANVNMETALNSINGTILEPGGTLSFNQCTGNSNLMSNGYLPAGVISQGAMTTGIGGGICQAATTLYNAAIMANMEIVEREPHLWCSYYVYGGLDATIDWGNIDLKVKNNSKYQMFFRCWMDGVVLNVEIYGWQSPEFDEVRTETELDWSSWEAYGYNAYRVFYKNGKKVRSEELPYSTYSLSNGGGIRGADLGNVSTKLTQPE
ncbi:MAG: VanW family protein [Clostridia bacterium]|nr:VanW family protein [Clostridia bacterium]